MKKPWDGAASADGLTPPKVLLGELDAVDAAVVLLTILRGEGYDRKQTYLPPRRFPVGCVGERARAWVSGSFELVGQGPRRHVLCRPSVAPGHAEIHCS